MKKDNKNTGLLYDKNKKYTPKELKNLIDVPLPPTGWQKGNMFLEFYLMPLVLFMFFLAGDGAIFLFKQDLGFLFIIVLIFYNALVFPVLLVIIGYSLIRTLFIDRNKITGAIIKKTSKTFFVMNFFLTQKRIVQRFVQINKDGLSIDYDNGIYIIDKEETWLDEDNFPNGYFLPNFPNQLKLDFAKYLLQISTENPNPLDADGNTIDIMYSAKNLKIFKNDKLFYEFHQQITPETMKMIAWLLILIGLMVGAIVFIIILMKK